MSIKYIINGSVLFDCEERTLRSQDQSGPALTLNTPASRCLQLLIERVGSVVSQREFFNLIWEQNGAYVTANTFYQNITIVRKGLKAVGLSADIIKTVPKEGVKFVAEVAVYTPPEELTDTLSENFVAETPLAEPDESALPTTEVQSTEHEESDASNTASSVDSAHFPYKLYEESRMRATTKRLSRGRKLNVWLSVGVIAFLFCLFSGYTYNQLSYGKHYFSEYNKIGVINDCLLFSSYFGREKSTEEFINFFRKGNITCSPGGVVYLTINRHNLASSILVCDKNIEDKNAHCISNLYRDNK